MQRMINFLMKNMPQFSEGKQMNGCFNAIFRHFDQLRSVTQSVSQGEVLVIIFWSESTVV